MLCSDGVHIGHIVDVMTLEKSSRENMPKYVEIGFERGLDILVWSRRRGC